MAKYKDYRSVEVMRAGKLTASKRRGGTDHEWVIGYFSLVDGHVVLRCVPCGPAYDIREDELTIEAERFARWRTKQAGWQWLQRRPGLGTTHRVIHLGRLDVL